MSKPQILCATLDVEAANGNGNLETWSPWVRFALQGPTPAGGQLTVRFQRPDGGDWFSLWSEAAEIGAEDSLRFDLWTAQDEYHSADSGTYPFQIKLESEIDGVDELLFEGKLEVVADDGKFVARHDWLLPMGAVGFNMEDADAPSLAFSWWLPGAPDTSRVSAYLFHAGKRVLSTESSDQCYIETSRTVHASDNSTALCTGFVAHLAKAKAWLNVEYADMEDWQVLSRQPGEYELKIAVDRKPVRALRFAVGDDGRIVAKGALRGERGSWWLPLRTQVIAKGESEYPSAMSDGAWYGSPGPQTQTTLDCVYAARNGAASACGDDQTGDMVSDELIDRAEKIYRWYYQDMSRGTTDSGDPVEPEQCQMAIERVDELLPELEGLVKRLGEQASLPFGDTRHSLKEIYGWMKAIRRGAQRIVDGRAAASEAELAPFRALLKGDKRKIFDQHPAGEYAYFTSKKRSIESPEELAAAEWWYFEGQEDAGYITEKWSVKGWRFNAAHETIDRVETSGHGVKAPSSAFK